MDPNDLYSLAQQTGMVDPGTPSYADSMDSSAPPQQGFSDEDILAHFVPQEEKPLLFQTGPQLTPPTPPGLSDMASPAAPPVPGRTSASVSGSGYNDAKNSQIRRGPGARLDAEIAGINAQGEQKAKDESQPYLDAGAAAKEAAHQEALATADSAVELGKQKAGLVEIANHYDNKTSEMVATSQAQAAQAKAQYVAALNDFRAARVNPAQLWDNMSGGDHVGMLAAAFVQDFLGARGINTSAMATFNKAIDRNIDSQLQAIKNKGQVADGFKTLWDMQTAESHSIEEARTRMRGFMLDSAKTAVEAHMSKFDAALATAKGGVATAKIDGEIAKNIAEVNQHVDSVTATRVNQALTRYGDDQRASMESYRIAADKQIAADRLKAEKPQTFNPYTGVIPDNSMSGQGMGRWEFNDPGNKELNNKYLEKQGEVDNTLKLIRQYREMQRMHGSNQGLASGTRWGTAEDQQLKALATEILGNRLLEKSGKAATDNERRALAIGTPQALFGGTIDVDKVLALTENIERQGLDSARNGIAHELDPNDPRRKLKVGGGDSSYGASEGKEAGAVASGEGSKKSPEQKATDSSVKDLEAHTAFDNVDDVGDYVKRDHEASLQAHPDTAASAKLTEELAPGVGGGTKDIKRYEQGLSRMKAAAEKAKEQASEAKTAKDVEQHQSDFDHQVALLKTYASKVISGTDPSDPIGLYALDRLHELGEDTPTVTDEQLGTDTATASHEELDPRVVLPPIPKKK